MMKKSHGKKKMTPAQKKIAGMAKPTNKITGADFKKLRGRNGKRG